MIGQLHYEPILLSSFMYDSSFIVSVQQVKIVSFSILC